MSTDTAIGKARHNLIGPDGTVHRRTSDVDSP